MKTLPHNDEAEKAILGSLLMREDAYDIVSGILDASDFYQPMNAVIFTAITKMKEASNRAIDYITLIDYLKKEGMLDKAGGLAYVASLTESVNVTANTEQYAEIVKEMSLRRSLISLCTSLTEKALNETEDIKQVLDEGQSEMLRLSLTGSRGETDYSITSAVSSVVDRIMKKMDGSLADDSVPSGFDILDKYTNGGFKPQDYIVVAARPSIGKTAFGVSMIRNMIRNTERPQRVAFFSLEMPASQITERLLANISHVNLRNIAQADLAEESFDRVMNAADMLFSKELYIIDVPNIRLNELRAKARSLKREKDITVIMIDYIGLIDPGLGPQTPRHEVIATVSRSLKSLARELKIPIIVLCQVSRDSEEKAPILSNLRDSGSIEQDADVVMFLHRKRILSEEEKQRNAKDSEGKATLQVTKVIVAKQRNGETGEFKVGYNATTTSFEQVLQNADFIEPTPPDKRGYEKK
ncbi:MAG: replicative DNA helicase [Spirochaetes bacterium]|uniref:Replicative DNA helicase n=1 Tax=Candidatus Ornithospirochaeta stercoripullorum TaxID=2840899 RepID=A0A9D9DZG0_9SPIO|nr:replicative DNA helicase [Candidatus Ornithospirochaeta stercoripullorum]